MQFTTHIEGTAVAFDAALVEKYDRPGPRYTSYPTAPHWCESIDHARYAHILTDSNAAARPLSLYLHLPFCERHCVFCGCNVVITTRKQVAVPYLEHVAGEVAVLARHLDTQRPVVQIHWGGGTPTYLSCAQLEQTWKIFTDHFTIAPDAEIGIEVDPRVTSAEQLRTLRNLGFNRVSMGVQDFDPRVQQAIGRIQPHGQTAALIDAARTAGFSSVNVDLIYGLPYQTPESFAQTVDAMVALAPDRIACFNFAFVPWLKAQQRTIDPATLPSPTDKIAMWCRTITQLADAGFIMIGFDHFARPDDELTAALRSRTLWRNFQGYSTKAGTDLVGIGITSIGDINGHYVQNGKTLPAYARAAAATQLPAERGCVLTPDDTVRRHVIRELLSNNIVAMTAVDRQFDIHFADYFAAALRALQPMCDDGLVTCADHTIGITPRGRLFARNIAMCFDAYLHAEDQRYSRTV